MSTEPSIINKKLCTSFPRKRESSGFTQMPKPLDAHLRGHDGIIVFLLLITISLFLYLALFSSCKKNEAGKEEPEKKPEKIHETVERGPAKVTLDSDKKEITIAE